MFYPNFFRWMDAASLRFFRAAGVPPWREFEAQSGIIGTPLVDASARFLRPASYGDVIDVDTAIDEWRGKSFVMSHIIRRGADVLVEGREVRVFARRHPDDPVAHPGGDAAGRASRLGASENARSEDMQGRNAAMQEPGSEKSGGLPFGPGGRALLAASKYLAIAGGLVFVGLVDHVDRVDHRPQALLVRRCPATSRCCRCARRSRRRASSPTAT